MHPLAYRCLIAYDGTDYCGWQIQPNGLSIQEVCEGILRRILQEPLNLTGSGRTDAGVHASGQVAHFHLSKSIDTAKLRHAFNALLPPAIRCLALDPTSNVFHARYSAIAKTYAYHFSVGSISSPFERRYRTHIKHPIHLEKMQSAIPFLLGTHNFSAFANEPTRGSVVHDATRTLMHINLQQEPHGWCLEFRGDGFLYKMVRNMVGTLFEIGAGKRPPEEIATILASKDRRLAGQTAPPQGLFLVSVEYPCP